MKATIRLLSLLFCLSLVLPAYQSEASSPVKQEPSQEKWEHYASDEAGSEYFYNPDTLKHLNGNRVQVWVRTVYSEKNPKYSQVEFQWEIDCSKKSMRGLTAKAKKKDGTQEIVKKPSDWSVIPSESTAETLYEGVCGKKDKKNP